MDDCNRDVEGNFRKLLERIAGLEQKVIDNDRFIQASFTAQEKAVTAALLASENAKAKAEYANEKRLDLLNEFRSQSKDKDDLLATKIEMNALKTEFMLRCDALGERISPITDWVKLQQGTREGLRLTWIWIVAAAGIAGTIIGIINNFSHK